MAEPGLAAVELLPTLLARACANVLGVDGAGISVFADDFRVPLGASDPVSAIAERLQFTLGVGPCLDAFRSAEPFRGDREHIGRRWPLFYAELVSRTRYQSIVSMPIQLGRSTGGAVDLYQRQADDVEALSLADMTAVMRCIVDALRWDAAQKAVDVPGPGWLHGPTAQDRVRVWVAIGMLDQEFDLSAPDALARLRAYAHAHDQSVDDVAGSLGEGHLAGRIPAALTWAELNWMGSRPTSGRPAPPHRMHITHLGGARWCCRGRGISAMALKTERRRFSSRRKSMAEDTSKHQFRSVTVGTAKQRAPASTCPSGHRNRED